MHKRTNLRDDITDIQSALQSAIGDSNISVFLTKTKKRINSPKYVIVFQYANKQLLKTLSARAYLMLSYLYTICDTANLIPLTWDEVCLDLGHKKRNVYAAVQQLKQNNLVLKIGNKYHLSPEIAWCGALPHWKATMDALSDSLRVKLPISRKKYINRMPETLIPINKLGVNYENSILNPKKSTG